MSLFHDNKPIFIQIKEKIEDQIVNKQLKEHDQIPSTTQMVHFYKVNHITISKGINLLVDEDIIYKKRGVGMFVAENARDKLLQNRRNQFVDTYVSPMIEEAKKLGLTHKDIADIMKKIEGV
ncbi:regulatory protein GntR, HTH [Alkaliphilus metalliredigens QYMF]|uniref:Regulatory protein GntR, HTH n=1 Tax=Alkaliphilus metalliredigens (strain QYMF) TaxID=293826 RepID=A6TV14_ALKMQ|nr:GntR family transcriptional regulator [Alkaliphilus metalliredigens]ABR50032.1 regulatory protein GntR, HTH [Alkaliphilus metalliredigens QYMF]